MSVTLDFVRGALLLDWLSYLGGLISRLPTFMSFSTKCWKGKNKEFFFSARMKTLDKLIKKQGTYNTFFVTTRTYVPLCILVRTKNRPRNTLHVQQLSTSCHLIKMGVVRPPSLPFLSNVFTRWGESAYPYKDCLDLTFQFHISQNHPKNSSLPRQCDSSAQTTSSHLNPTYKLPFSAPAADIYKTCSNLQKKSG